MISKKITKESELYKEYAELDVEVEEQAEQPTDQMVSAFDQLAANELVAGEGAALQAPIESQEPAGAQIRAAAAGGSPVIVVQDVSEAPQTPEL